MQLTLSIIYIGILGECRYNDVCCETTKSRVVFTDFLTEKSARARPRVLFNLHHLYSMHHMNVFARYAFLLVTFPGLLCSRPVRVVSAYIWYLDPAKHGASNDKA